METFILSENPKNIIYKAYNGQQAIDIVKEKKIIDIIFMDCNMPVLNGYQSSEQIKELMETNYIQKCPILALSAYCKSNEDLNWKKAGMDDFIEKPLTKKKFREIYICWLVKYNGDLSDVL